MDINATTLAFHWMLPKAGEVARKTAQEAAKIRLQSTRDNSGTAVTDIEGWTRFGLCAEDAGIESLLISFSRYEPDPLVIACALGQVTTRLKFLAAYRSGLIQPTSFVQQINTLSNLIDGRVALNIVAGSSPTEQRSYGDFLDHDERYARADEMLAICDAFWKEAGDVDFDGKYYQLEGGNLHTKFQSPNLTAPQIYISGHSDAAQQLAFSRGSCWVRTADTPEALAAPVANARKNGVEVCLRCAVICRPTLQEAIDAGMAMLPENVGDQSEIVSTRRDSQMVRESLATTGTHWPKPWLWTGLVPHNGPVWIVLLGTPEMLADALLEYKQIGVTQFILSGWPELAEMQTFGREVIPLIRQTEDRRIASS